MANIALLVCCFMLGVLLRQSRRLPENAPAALNGFIIHLSLLAAILLYVHRVPMDASLIQSIVAPCILWAAGILLFATAARALGWSTPTSGGLILLAAALAAAGGAGWPTPAQAGSDHSSATYAGDYTAGSFPTGTFIALQYLGHARANAFISSSGRELPDSHADIYHEFTRLTYFGQLWGQPLVLEAAAPFATLTDAHIPGTNSLVAGGLADPALLLTYFFVADAKVQRWVGFTSHFYLPLGRYDNRKAINVSTADQFTYVPQIGYTEGLEKIAPALKGVFLDLTANASFHGDGDNPVAFVNPEGARVPGVLTYDALRQETSYNVKTFLRYEPKTFLFAAVGIEKSWGGEQTIVNGRFSPTGRSITISQPDLSISRDDYLRGHFQFQFPVARDFLLAADVFHDFDRVGGFRNDLGVELRLTKLFFPQTPTR